ARASRSGRCGAGRWYSVSASRPWQRVSRIICAICGASSADESADRSDLFLELAGVGGASVGDLQLDDLARGKAIPARDAGEKRRERYVTVHGQYISLLPSPR